MKFESAARRIRKFADEHPRLIGGGLALLATALLAKEEYDKYILVETVEKQNGTIANQEKALEDYREREEAHMQRMEEKDRRHLEVISDGMRHGSSKAAEDMAEWRKYKKYREEYER